jgi:hypothetical protein
VFHKFNFQCKAQSKVTHTRDNILHTYKIKTIFSRVFKYPRGISYVNFELKTDASENLLGDISLILTGQMVREKFRIFMRHKASVFTLRCI